MRIEIELSPALFSKRVWVHVQSPGCFPIFFGPDLLDDYFSIPKNVSKVWVVLSVRASKYSYLMRAAGSGGVEVIPNPSNPKSGCWYIEKINNYFTGLLCSLPGRKAFVSVEYEL
jgi:hypothetical protein